MSNTPSLIIDDESNKKSLKRLRHYFEICKRNINCEKKKKYEVNEKMLETDLNKKILLELKYHELSSTIGWIQISIIVASTGITFIQTVDGLYPIDSYIVSIVIISLSTYVALILAISRFFKLDEQKELIVNLLSTFAMYINKLKARQQILIDHQFNYYKREIDYEYSEWSKLKDLFEKDGSAELKINIDNQIDMLLTKKDVLKYKEEMLRLQLQEFIIAEQSTIYNKVEPLMFKNLLKYKFEVGCLNNTCFRYFFINSFHTKARELYSKQEIEKILLGSTIEQKNNELNKIDSRIKELINDQHRLKKYKKISMNDETQIKVTELINSKNEIREQLNEIKKDDKKKAVESYKTNQTVESINRHILNNMRIETELGMRDYISYNSRDITKKHNALNNYNYVYNHTPSKDDFNKIKNVEQDIERNLYYPDEFYGITHITPNLSDNKLETYKNYYNGSNSSYSYSSDESDNENNIKIKERPHRRSIHHTEVETPTIIPDKLGSLNDLTLQAISSIHNTSDSTHDGLDISDVDNNEIPQSPQSHQSPQSPQSHQRPQNKILPKHSEVSLWNKFNILGFVKNENGSTLDNNSETSEECDKPQQNIEEV